MEAIFEAYAYAVVVGTLAVSCAVIYILKVLNIGDHYVISPLIGSALGIIILLVSPMAYIAAFIVSGVVTLASSLILHHFW